MVAYILVELKDLGCYISNKSVTTSSYYLKFKHELLRSLTVRDHESRPKYKYKWNIILGGQQPRMVKDENVVRFFYNEQTIDWFIGDIRKYYNNLRKAGKA